MTTFQQTALILIIIWLVIISRFHRSRIVLIGGLFVIGLYTIMALAYRQVTFSELGLGTPHSWLSTLGYALAGPAVMIAYSPVADRLATRWFERPPTLDAFGAIQQSTGKLIAGIVVAWVLGGILEELIARGVVLQSIKTFLGVWLVEPVATVIAICMAATGAGLLHFYQGPRAVVIITQLSILFGVLFVVSGYNLCAVMICHGLYDTIAFIRFATRKSRYSSLVGTKDV
jgi:membrane protease YdiL (CAAX protease family)